MTESEEVSGRKRRSSAEIKRLVTEFQTSGLRQNEFCRNHGLALSSLQRQRILGDNARNPPSSRAPLYETFQTPSQRLVIVPITGRSIHPSTSSFNFSWQVYADRGLRLFRLVDPAVIHGKPTIWRLGINFHKAPIPEDILVGVIGRTLDGRRNYWIDANDRCHQSRVALSQGFRRHSVEGAAFIDYMPEGQRHRECGQTIKLKFEWIKPANAFSSS